MVIALSILVFTAAASVLSGLQRAPASFAGEHGYVISSLGAPTIFSSRVDLGMATALEQAKEQLQFISGISPETFAFSSWQGHSFVVRGVDLEKLNSTGLVFRSFIFVGNKSAGDRASAVIGSGLLERMNLELPCTMSLVGSYSSRVDIVNVVGWFETGTSLDDELLVSPECAQFLSGMPEDKVSILRVGSDDPASLLGLLSPTGPAFTIFELHSSKRVVAVGESFEVSVSVRNWGGSPGAADISYAQNTSAGEEKSLGVVRVSLNATSSTRLVRWITLSDLGKNDVGVRIGGDFPITLRTEVTVVDPYIVYWGPGVVMTGTTFKVTVRDYAGHPVANALVQFDEQSQYTDVQGRASFSADEVGNFVISGYASGYSGFNSPITVLGPTEFPNVFTPEVVEFQLSSHIIGESESVTGVVQVSNRGTAPGFLDIAVAVDDPPVQQLLLNVSLETLETKQVAFTLSDLPIGVHYVTADKFTRELSVQAWFAAEPDLVQLVVRYGGTSQLSGAGSIPIYQAAKLSEGNVEVVLFSIGAIAALLAALAITSVFSKEVREGRRRLGILKTIGASRRDIIGLVFPQALKTGFIGSAFGVLVGVAMADQLSRAGVFFLFGHNLRIEWSIELLVLILLAAISISVVSALASAMVAVRETAISSIRDLAEAPREPLGLEELLGD